MKTKIKKIKTRIKKIKIRINKIIKIINSINCVKPINDVVVNKSNELKVGFYKNNLIKNFIFYFYINEQLRRY